MKKFQNEDTAKNYMQNGLQLFLFLFSCKTEKERNGQIIFTYIYHLAEFSISLYECLTRNMDKLKDAINSPGYKKNYGFEDLIFAKIHNIFKSLFFRKQPFSDSRTSDICYCFWAIQAYEVHSKSFKKASLLTQSISKMLFLMRLVVLMECHINKSHLINLMNPKM